MLQDLRNRRSRCNSSTRNSSCVLLASFSWTRQAWKRFIDLDMREVCGERFFPTWNNSMHVQTSPGKTAVQRKIRQTRKIVGKPPSVDGSCDRQMLCIREGLSWYCATLSMDDPAAVNCSGTPSTAARCTVAAPPSTEAVEQRCCIDLRSSVVGTV